MAVVNEPIFVQGSGLAHVQFATPNTARDGTGTIATLITGDADGTIVELVRLVATGTTTAGVIRIWLSSDGGTTWRLHDEVLVTAITPSTSVAVWESDWIPVKPLVLASASWKIGLSTHNAETFNGTAYAGIY